MAGGWCYRYVAIVVGIDPKAELIDGYSARRVGGGRGLGLALDGVNLLIALYRTDIYRLRLRRRRLVLVGGLDARREIARNGRADAALGDRGVARRGWRAGSASDMPAERGEELS